MPRSEERSDARKRFVAVRNGVVEFSVDEKSRESEWEDLIETLYKLIPSPTIPTTVNPTTLGAGFPTVNASLCKNGSVSVIWSPVIPVWWYVTIEVPQSVLVPERRKGPWDCWNVQEPEKDSIVSGIRVIDSWSLWFR